MEKEAPITPVDVVEQLCSTLERTLAALELHGDERNKAVLEEAAAVLDGSRVWLDSQYC